MPRRSPFSPNPCRAKKLGAKLKEWRRNARLTLKQLESRSGLCYSTLSRLENGKSGMTFTQMEVLAQALDRQLRDFLEV
jgi:transcriptional regulator with XRE-family HTH domain